MEGTISWLVGFHSIFHSIYTYLAWIKLYKKVPTFRETFCIFIHDIGYCGMNYYTNKSHEGHEILGAKIAGKLFGKEYHTLVLKHRVFDSKLEKPDEYSHCLMPLFIMKCQWLAERKRFTKPVKWKLYCKNRWTKRMRGEKMRGQFEECYSNCTKEN
jgi:hypothetical protein